MLPGPSPRSGEVERLLTDYGRGLPAAGRRPASRALTVARHVGQPIIGAGVNFSSAALSAAVSRRSSANARRPRPRRRRATVGGTLAGTLAAEMVYVNRPAQVELGRALLDAYAVSGRIEADGHDRSASNRVTFTDTIHRQTVRRRSPASRRFRSDRRHGGSRSPAGAHSIPVVHARRQDLQLRRRRACSCWTITTTHAVPVAWHALSGGGQRRRSCYDTSYYGATSPILRRSGIGSRWIRVTGLA